tara:strand:+ start:8 stop:973 length:966 start_codon:yes stop_codon:yes gene_type:complete
MTTVKKLFILIFGLFFWSCEDESKELIIDDLWGQEINDPPEYYKASDVPNSQVDQVIEYFEIASTAWGNYGPLEFWIIGTDPSSAQQLDSLYCETRIEKDNVLTENDFQSCLNRGYNFIEYANQGGAGLNTQRNPNQEYSVFIVTLASKYPFPNEPDYNVVTMHEYFHVYQHAHIFTLNDNERSNLMVRNPWWSEGGANYLSELLYSQQPGVSSNYLKERMRWKMNEKSDFIASGKRLEDIEYDEENNGARFAYDLGAWFIAYLINQVGIDNYRVNFYDDLNELGFEASFVENFGKSSGEFLDEFHAFLHLDIENQLEIIP